jgi:MFS family permease
MMHALSLAALAFSPLDSNLKILLLIALCAFQGVINAFDTPGRMVLIVGMVEDPDDLGNAVALNSSIANLARMIGPPIAGVAVALVGEGWCFLADGLSYIAVIASLLMIRMRRHERVVSQKTAFEEMCEGWRYVRSFVPVKTVLLLMCILNFAGMPYQVLLPAFAGNILKGGSSVFGFLMAAAAVGSLIGTGILAARHSMLGLDKLISVTAAVFGLGLMLLSATHVLWTALPLMVAVGFGSILSQISCNALLQSVVDDDKRGRVMGFYTMSQMGMVSMGGLLMGALSGRIGVAGSLIVCGLCCLAGAEWFMRSLPELRRHAYPVYRRKANEFAAGGSASLR